MPLQCWSIRRTLSPTLANFPPVASSSRSDASRRTIAIFVAAIFPSTTLSCASEPRIFSAIGSSISYAFSSRPHKVTLNFGRRRIFWSLMRQYSRCSRVAVPVASWCRGRFFIRRVRFLLVAPPSSLPPSGSLRRCFGGRPRLRGGTTTTGGVSLNGLRRDTNIASGGDRRCRIQGGLFAALVFSRIARLHQGPLKLDGGAPSAEEFPVGLKGPQRVNGHQGTVIK